MFPVGTQRRAHPRFGRLGRLGRPRDRFDPAWWGEAPAEGEREGYWAATRRPLPSLLFVLPLLFVYESGLAWAAGATGPAPSHRAGADAWIRHAFAAAGLTDRWLLPLLLVCALLAWQVADRRGWRFPPLVPAGMLAESFGLALLLIGLSRLVDVGFCRLDDRGLLATAGNDPGPASVVLLLGFLGAGIYEEALFRLAAIPLMYHSLRFVRVPGLAASTLAISVSSLLFSLAHHAGGPGESFTLFAFVFRWLAGVFFAYVFVARGYGVAVGTHSAYDLLVGWFDVHF